MKTRQMLHACAAGLFASAVATPAAGQFDPQHGRLKCYKLGGRALLTRVGTRPDAARSFNPSMLAFECIAP